MNPATLLLILKALGTAFDLLGRLNIGDANDEDVKRYVALRHEIRKAVVAAAHAATPPDWSPVFDGVPVPDHFPVFDGVPIGFPESNPHSDLPFTSSDESDTSDETDPPSQPQ